MAKAGVEYLGLSAWISRIGGWWEFRSRRSQETVRTPVLLESQSSQSHDSVLNSAVQEQSKKRVQYTLQRAIEALTDGL